MVDKIFQSLIQIYNGINAICHILSFELIVCIHIHREFQLADLVKSLHRTTIFFVKTVYQISCDTLTKLVCYGTTDDTHTVQELGNIVDTYKTITVT